MGAGAGLGTGGAGQGVGPSQPGHCCHLLHPYVRGHHLVLLILGHKGAMVVLAACCLGVAGPPGGFWESQASPQLPSRRCLSTHTAPARAGLPLPYPPLSGRGRVMAVAGRCGDGAVTQTGRAWTVLVWGHIRLASQRSGACPGTTPMLAPASGAPAPTQLCLPPSTPPTPRAPSCAWLGPSAWPGFSRAGSCGAHPGVPRPPSLLHMASWGTWGWALQPRGPGCSAFSGEGALRSCTERCGPAPGQEGRGLGPRDHPPTPLTGGGCPGHPLALPQPGQRKAVPRASPPSCLG